jgi:beta-aspartyl-dipeptidase (metallo-type)
MAMGKKVEKGESGLRKEPLAKLIQGGELYCPDYRGKGDVLVVGGIIARIAPRITVPKDLLDLQIIDATDMIITPGFIDQHVHLIGTGGPGGPAYRTREIKIQQIIQAGVTTVAGVLGSDILTMDLKRLLAKAQGLEAQGITTFIYTGAFVVPSPTLTGSIESDFLLINKVVGVKLGLGDPSSTYPTEQEIKALITAALRGGKLSGKAGIVHIHMGPNPRDYYRIVEKILQETMIPISQVIFTHSGRSSSIFEGALEFAKKGGLVDVTAVHNPDFQPDRVADGLKKPCKAIAEMLSAGISENQITMSSDSNASGKGSDGRPRYGSIQHLFKEFQDIALCLKDLPWALKIVTWNPAKRLAITSRKGSLEEGKDADLLVLTRDLQIEEVYAQGRTMMKNGEAVVKDPFE